MLRSNEWSLKWDQTHHSILSRFKNIKKKKKKTLYLFVSVEGRNESHVIRVSPSGEGSLPVVESFQVGAHGEHVGLDGIAGGQDAHGIAVLEQRPYDEHFGQGRLHRKAGHQSTQGGQFLFVIQTFHFPNQSQSNSIKSN